MDACVVIKTQSLQIFIAIYSYFCIHNNLCLPRVAPTTPPGTIYYRTMIDTLLILLYVAGMPIIATFLKMAESMWQ